MSWSEMILTIENHYQPYFSISHYYKGGMMRPDRSAPSPFHHAERST